MSRGLQDRIVNTSKQVGFFLTGWVFSMGLSVGNPIRVNFEYNGLDQQVVNNQSSVAYNTAGDQLKDSKGNVLGFNGWDQQTSMTLADGKAYQYGFCPDGLQCQKQVQGQTLNLYPDQQSNLVDESLDAPETDENGDTGHETLGGEGWAVSGENGRIIASKAVSEANVTAQYDLKDDKGSRLGETNSTGSLTSAIQYSAYGVRSSVGNLFHLFNVVSSRSSQPVLRDAVAIGMRVDENPLGYNGQIQNAEDGYVLSETRPYNPDEKRFPNQDLEITEPNLYAFVSGQGGNPINDTDSQGTRLDFAADELETIWMDEYDGASMIFDDDFGDNLNTVGSEDEVVDMSRGDAVAGVEDAVEVENVSDQPPQAIPKPWESSVYTEGEPLLPPVTEEEKGSPSPEFNFPPGLFGGGSGAGGKDMFSEYTGQMVSISSFGPEIAATERHIVSKLSLTQLEQVKNFGNAWKNDPNVLMGRELIAMFKSIDIRESNLADAENSYRRIMRGLRSDNFITSSFMDEGVPVTEKPSIVTYAAIFNISNEENFEMIRKMKNPNRGKSKV